MSQFFQEQLETLLHKKLQLKINDNRSTMLSIKWEPDYTKVSLHRMFLQAPTNVMQQLACYINRDDETIPKAVRTYIEENLKKLDYSHTLDRSKLQVAGNYYHLQEVYDGINAEYFQGKLPLLITWFGPSHNKPKKRRQMTLGLFHDQLKLIKINRFLDHQKVPLFLVRYVVYHEMLHFVCPSYVDDRGQHKIHSREFKAREKLFSHYQEAQQWIQDNQKILFK